MGEQKQEANNVTIRTTSQQALQKRKDALEFYDKTHICPMCKSTDIYFEDMKLLENPDHIMGAMHIYNMYCRCNECGCEYDVSVNEEALQILYLYGYGINRGALSASISRIEETLRNTIDKKALKESIHNLNDRLGLNCDYPLSQKEEEGHDI